MKKILSILGALALVAVIGVAGTTAYFSDTATSTSNTFTAGTLNLTLANTGQPYTDGVSATWSSPSNWAPGETKTATLYLQNSGTIDIGWIGIKPAIVSNPDFADKILITNFTMSDGTKTTGNLAGSMATWGIWGTTAPLTLEEFASGVYWFYTDTHDFLLLANNANTVTLTMELTFDPTANNTYQGASGSFDLSVRALQYNSGGPSNYTFMGSASCGYGD